MDNSKFDLLNVSHELVLDVYRNLRYFPKEEEFGLCSQMRRASVSIPSNISEGKSIESKKEYKRFLYISRASLEELKYQIYLSKDLGYIKLDSYETINKKIDRVGKMLNGMIRKLS